MKWLIHLLLLATVAMASVSEPDRQLFAPSRNLLPNGGFENGKAGWVASGGTFVTTTTGSNIGYGNMAVSWTGSASAQTLATSQIPIPAGMYGRNGVASCLIKGAGATHLIQVTDGTNTLISSSITSVSTYARSVVNFIFPSSGNIVLQLQTVASSEPQIFIDDCFIQPADTYNIGQVSQASLLGTAHWSRQETSSVGFFHWSGTGTSPGTASYADNNTYPFGVFTGAVSQPAAVGGVLQFGAQFTGGPGTYNMVVQTVDNCVGCGNGGSDFMEVVDENSNLLGWGYQQIVAGSGNNQAPQWGLTVSYTYTIAGTHSWYVRRATNGGNLSDSLGVQQSSLIVSYLPSAAQLAFTPSTSDWTYNLMLVDNTAGALYTSDYASPTTYVPMFSSTMSLVPLQNSLSAFISCNGTTFNTGGGCGGDTPDMGAVVNIPHAGLVDVYMNLNFCWAGSASLFEAVKLVEVANGTQTIIQETPGVEWGNLNAGLNTQTCSSVLIRGPMYFSSTGFHTIKALAENSQGITRLSSYIQINNNSGTPLSPTSGTAPVLVIKPINSAGPAPIILGGVTAPSGSGTEVLARVNFGGAGSNTSPTSCTSDPCTIYTQSGSWVTAVNFTGTGEYVIHIAPGTFSDAPSCSNSSPVGGNAFCNQVGNSLSTVELHCYQSDNSPNVINVPVNVVCMGPH